MYIHLQSSSYFLFHEKIERLHQRVMKHTSPIKQKDAPECATQISAGAAAGDNKGTKSYGKVNQHGYGGGSEPGRPLGGGFHNNRRKQQYRRWTRAARRRTAVVE